MGDHQELRFGKLRRLSKGAYPAATIRYARRYLLDYPDDGLAWLLLGIELTAMARYEEAEQALVKALDLRPTAKSFLPLIDMGHLFKYSGDFDQAAAWYRKAAEADPTDATGYIFLGAVLARQGRFGEAEEAHRTATACPEGCVDEAYLNLGFVWRARERFAEAAECFREAIRLDPDYREAKSALRDVERCLKWARRRQV
jgi:tetratricopeptide (TPR) repeat protein